MVFLSRGWWNWLLPGRVSGVQVVVLVEIVVRLGTALVRGKPRRGAVGELPEKPCCPGRVGGRAMVAVREGLPAVILVVAVPLAVPPGVRNHQVDPPGP